MGTKVHGGRAQEQAARNLRTGLILAAIALAFALGFVVRVWLS
jgi:hypothetical protein